MGRIALSLLLLASLAYAKEWKLHINGMHCIACTLAVKKALMSVSGVQEAKVNFKNESALVISDEKVTLRMMQDAVAQTGYSAIPMEQK
ncbi:heavy metal-associated domain-containing protein [Sulfuricurvum sp.]|jgi:Cu+-exporting ATPase|uniref:heavy-metal-associated domain-containing protein n=1 Tax=Sulfuricurvum sp. TaxID=2025608 RepID=UPI00261A865B|nr:heavy metal-associated domain-containing protein [Sulfuricurvum sp.]MDD2781029.1 heavy metal-associated domain-containing protein [Sulfuricurvum sp.]